MAIISEQERALIAAAQRRNAELPAHCEDCGLGYELDIDGCPVTARPFTCDDCGGAVEPGVSGNSD